MRTQVRRNRRRLGAVYNKKNQAMSINSPGLCRRVITCVEQGRGEEMHRMPKTLTLGLGLIAILSFVALTGIGQETMKPPKTVTINGKVSAVTETTLTVIDDQKASQIIAIDAKTKIWKAGKDATAADIKPDDAVVVVATKGEGNALTAVTIKVT
jgi:hypothetical protein